MIYSTIRNDDFPKEQKISDTKRTMSLVSQKQKENLLQLLLHRLKPRYFHEFIV